MVALSASKLVCSATALIILTTSPIRLADWARSAIRALVCSTWLTASRDILCESCTWRLISDTDEAISSAAAAADCALAEDCSDAEATVADSIWVTSAVLVSCPADDSSSEEAVDTVWMIFPIAESKPSAICCIAALRSPSAFSFRLACSCSIDCTRSAFSLKTWTARAMAPTSSPRLSAGTETSRSPPASPSSRRSFPRSDE